MLYKHKFDLAATVEFEDSYLWYFNQSEKVANRFESAVNAAIKSVCKNPYFYATSYNDLREKVLKKFPFSIVYLIDELNETILIVSIFHHKREPGRKYNT